MFRSTTPTLYFRIKNIDDLHIIEDVWVTIKGTQLFLNYTMDDVNIDYENKIISVALSQSDTLMFKTPEVKIQLKVYTTNHKVCASPILKMKVEDVLNSNLMKPIDSDDD